MGRSNQGKNQEVSQVDKNNATADQDTLLRNRNLQVFSDTNASALAANNARQQQDWQNTDKQISGYNSNVAGLATNPGYTPDDLRAMQAERSAQVHGVYGSAGDTLKRTAAIAGHANDTGIGPQLMTMARDRAMAEAAGNNSIAGKQADAVLTTRRGLPGMMLAPAGIRAAEAESIGGQNTNLIGQKFQPAALAQSGIATATGNNTGLVTGRMSADNSPTFLQQMALAGISGAGNAFKVSV